MTEVQKEMTLDSLPFIDLYVRLDGSDTALYRSKVRGEGLINQIVPEWFAPVIERFRLAVAQRLGDHNDGSIDFEGVRCRLSRQQMSDESAWVCARRINTILPELDKLGIAEHFYKHMHTLGVRDGLILVSGATG